MDSIRGGPLAGATVTAMLEDTANDPGHITETGPDGEFAWRGLRSGRYLVAATRSWLNSAGLQSFPAEATVQPGADD